MPKPPSLPGAELDVMAQLWRRGKLTARELREALRDHRPMSHSAMCTLLSRLEEKRLVVRQKADKGKAFVYRAKSKPNKTYERLVGDMLDRVFGGSGVALVSSLFEARHPTEDEIEELQGLLDKLRKKPSPKSRKKP